MLDSNCSGPIAAGQDKVSVTPHSFILRRIFVISQLAPRTISDKEMKTRLEQHFHTFITKFIPLSESQIGNEDANPDVKPMKFCTKCHKSFQACKCIDIEDVFTCL